MGEDVAQIVTELKTAPLIILLSIFIVLLSSLLTIANSFSLLSGLYTRTVGRKRAQLAKLARLAAGVNIAFFENFLGPPAFVRKIPIGREHVFVHRNFYVQGITDEDNSVIAFFVTTRKANFNPTLTLFPVRIKLGKTRFQALDTLGKPDECSYSEGARGFSYYETRFLGNPGHYQTFFFALNDAGYYSDYYKYIPSSMQGDHLSADQPEVAEFRSDACVNTYGITAPHFEAGDLKGVISIGPNVDQVRILGI
jgi:hypothetical protein